MANPQQQEEENEVLAHRFHMDIFLKGDMSAADQILAENFIWRNPNVPPELAHGHESVKKIASSAREIMPDINITHDYTMSKGDQVLIRWSMTGTPKKELFGIPASDKPITAIGFDLFRIASGKLVEMWQLFGPGSWK
jgi:steroid delta-isomerase-like uncharacterized protein